MAQVVTTLLQGRQGIKYIWLLFDTCSSNSVSQNFKVVNNIKECNGKNLLTFFKNGDPKPFYHEADLNRLPLQVQYNKDSMATVMAFKDASNIRRSRINTDTSKVRSVIVTFSDGK